jgi:hypothetical protein
MKSDDVPASKFKEDMVRKWQNVDDESCNLLVQHYLVPVGKGANIRSAVMRSLSVKCNANQITRVSSRIMR